MITGDLRGLRETRIIANVATVGAGTPAKLQLQYSVDSGATWSYLDGSGGAADGTGGTGSGPSINVNLTGLVKSSWTTMNAAALADDVWIRCVGIDGNATSDPFGTVIAQFR